MLSLSLIKSTAAMFLLQVPVQMDTNTKTCFSLSILVSFFLLFSHNAHLSGATDTISPGQSLVGNQTIVSKGGIFELGFFSPGKSSNFYIGIWYKQIPNQVVVWVANREKPVPNTSSTELKVSKEGNLVLLNNSQSPIWSSNSSPTTSTSNVAVLLDTGNLILRDELNSSAIIWQSFDHMTDTFLPGAWLGMDKITGEFNSITSWKNSEDPAPGPFSDGLDPDGADQYVFLWNKSKMYWSSGLWNGQFFAGVPMTTKKKTIFNLTFFHNKQRNYAMYTLTDNSKITRFVIDPSGQGNQWLWLSSTQQWLLINSIPIAKCEVYSYCGAFGVCDQKSSTPCSCSDGFEPASRTDWDLNAWSSGCKRKTCLQCNNSASNRQKDGFLDLPNMQLPAHSNTLIVRSFEECSLACLNNCSCTAYAYDSGCSIWNGDLLNLQQLYDGDRNGGTLYLRLAASDLPSSSSRHQLLLTIILSAVASVLAILFIVFGLIWRSRRGKLTRMEEQVEGSLVIFKYSDLQSMTKKFSEKLGSGGFGSVFKGELFDSTAIAVKKLEGFRQGEKQFRTEVSMLSVIQHVNLVRLRGLCFEGSKRLLVYDYMPRGSLDSHLFQNKSPILDWGMRYQIILGVARGLAYLHEKCRECIVHCDIKPDNILLDAEFCPKVSDFGMAKLIGRDFSRVLTTMRGTIGYLAPEWLSGLPITPKVDVYSFGMMLFELISGRRNTEQSQDESVCFFPLWAAGQVIKGNSLSLLDKRLEGDADTEELSRVCKVACWCIQDSEAHRPSMGHIVQILEGVLEVNMPPVPKILQHLMEDQSSVAYHYELE